MHGGDTRFFVDLFDPERSHHRAATTWDDAHGNQPLFAPTVSFWERVRGAIGVSDTYVSQIQEFMAAVEPLPLTTESALEAARIEQQTRTDGEQVAKADCLIAGVVRNVGGSLVTRDGDFERVPALRIVRY